MNTMKTTNEEKFSLADILNDRATENSLAPFAKEGERTVFNQIVAISDLARALGKSERTLMRDFKEMNYTECVIQVGRKKYVLYNDFIEACKQYMQVQQEEIAELKERESRRGEKATTSKRKRTPAPLPGSV